MLEKIKNLENITLEDENSTLDPPKEPFLPKITNYRYTLVLDLDETLVHYVDVK